MPSVRLDFYSIRLRERGDKEAFVSFDSVIQDNSFIDIFQKFVKTFEDDLDINDVNKKTFQFKPNSLKFSSENRKISGILKSGEFGRSSEVFNIITKTAKPPLDKNDSVINPFYFLIQVPKESQVGFLVLQRFGQQGITGIFTDHFCRFVRQEFQGFTVDFSPLASKELLMKMIDKGTVNEITLRKYNLPTDLADKYYHTGLQVDKTLTAEFKLHSGGVFGNAFKDKVKNYINQPEAMFFDIPALQSLGFDSNTETAIRVETGNSTRTIILNHFERFKTSFDIQKDVTFESNGHPNFESIDAIAKELLKEHFYASED